MNNTYQRPASLAKEISPHVCRSRRSPYNPSIVSPPSWYGPDVNTEIDAWQAAERRSGMCWICAAGVREGVAEEGEMVFEVGVGLGIGVGGDVGGCHLFRGWRGTRLRVRRHGECCQGQRSLYGLGCMLPLIGRW